MATIDKTKSQTYNFLSENKSIEDIKKQENIEIREKRRHGGKTIKIFNKINREPLWRVDNNNLSENNRENLEQVTSNLTNEVKEQETNNDIWTKLKYYLNLSTPSSNTEEIQKLNYEIQQLKKQIEELKQTKESDVNLTKFSYNAITIYDEKQIKNTGIEKIHEEILSIEDKIIFITTFIDIDNSITEKLLYFDYYKNNDDLQIVNQVKKYQNINEYKNDFSLIEDTSTNKNNCQYVPIKDFLKKQQDFKLKPTKGEIGKWIISWLIIPLGVTAINLIHPPLLVMSLVIGGIAIVLRGGLELFSPTAKKVWSWLSNKWNENEELKIKNKKEREARIENLTSDKLETKLKTQYDILKQELNNRKNNNPDKLISNNKINHNSNSILKNSNIENNQNFDSSVRDTINQQELQPSTISANTWNKVKCLLT